MCLRSWIQLICAIFSVSVSADDVGSLLQTREAALSDCMAHLPARQSMAWQDSRGRGPFPAACKVAKRSRDDARDMAKLRDSLMKMYDAAPEKPVPRAEAEAEAEDIAVRLVEATRKTAQEFRMVNSPFLNNILVNIGAKDAGQCYQWVRVLMAAFPAKPYAAFERSWGGAYLNRIMENNGVIFTVRGQPFSTGIVYDAWRGRGDPWWRAIQKDHYPWMQRFSESQVLAGEAQVTGNAELKRAKAKSP